MIWRRAGLVLAAATLAFGSRPADAAPPADPKESRLHLFGIWPNRLRLFDEATEEFVADIGLKYGAATNSTHSPDFSKFYFVTDRMEAVEIVDLKKRAVVDTVKLSAQSRQIRILNVAVNPAGTLLYLTATPVTLEIDRFVPEEQEIFVYDLEAKKLKDSLKLPKEVQPGGFRPNIQFSPDGNSMFLFGRDIYEVRVSDNQIASTIKLSKPILAGYGPMRGARMTEEAPGVFYGIYRTQDPFMKKTMLGVLSVDLLKKDVESFELGPDVKVGLFALSSDHKRAYAGVEELVSIDMESRRILKRVQGVEQGRTNNSLLVSADGSKLYISGVGDMLKIYDAETLSHVKDIFAGGDYMATPVAIPRAAATSVR